MKARMRVELESFAVGHHTVNRSHVWVRVAMLYSGLASWETDARVTEWCSWFNLSKPPAKKNQSKTPEDG